MRPDVFRAFRAGVAAGRAGGTAPGGVQRGQRGGGGGLPRRARFAFGRIAEIIERVLEAHRPEPVRDLETVRAADRWARARARMRCWRERSFNNLWPLIVTLGVLIFVHELGHFLAAKWAGIRVHRFALGMGNPIPGLSFRRGHTEYAHLLAAAGRVRQDGEPGRGGDAAARSKGTTPTAGRRGRRRWSRTSTSRPSRCGSG